MSRLCGRAFQAEETGSTKALRGARRPVCVVDGTVGRVEQNEIKTAGSQRL